jgi:HAD superfamily hydrolase (TIGR01490 family)
MADNTSSKNLIIFDFDNTITTRDSFLDFAIYSHKTLDLLKSFIFAGPILALYTLRLVNNQRAKETLFSQLYNGMTFEEFDSLCNRYCKEKLPRVINPKVIKLLQEHLKKGDEVVVISASISNWVRPYVLGLGDITVIATEVESSESGVLTGKFATPNCFGEEKVSRLEQLYTVDVLNKKKLTVYSDSMTDKPLYDIADKSFYVKGETIRKL